MFAFGDTIAIAAVYGPKKMHPQHSQNPEKGTLRCNYNMLSFSVTERIRPGPNRRSTGNKQDNRMGFATCCND